VREWRKRVGRCIGSTCCGKPLPAEQARIVRLLVERVEVGPAGADIRLRVDGLASLVRDLGSGAPDAARAPA
jgi:hypothetical protein